jgi:hypothetical protein
MNEQLQQALAEILNKATAGVESGAAFLQAELPDVIQQLLMWKMAAAILSILISIVIIYAYAKALISYAKSDRSNRFWHDGYDTISPFGFTTLLAGGIASFFCVLCIIDSLFDVLQIWIAPKIYLIEYAASLAK